MLGLTPNFEASAQSQTVLWQFIVDGRAEKIKLTQIPELNQIPLDSLNFVSRIVLENIQGTGYYLAAIDSVKKSPSSDGQVWVQIFIDRGDEIPVSSIVLDGAAETDARSLASLMSTRRGRVLRYDVLQNDIERMLRYYEESGYPFTRIEIKELAVAQDAEGKRGLVLRLQVDEGGRVRINDIVLSGAERTSRSYVERVTGLRKGAWLNQDLREVRQLLEDSQFFKRVYDPVFIAVSENEAVLQIPVEEQVPGAFDLVMGYQPPGDAGRAGGLVGSGHLNLRNMFGQGRDISIRLNRLPGQISRVEAGYIDPFLFGLPFSVETGFEGIQQDSTFGQQKYLGALGYKLGEGLDVFFSVSREVTKPGAVGLTILQGKQRIPRSDVLFAGISFRYRRLDRVENPRKGLFLETRLERGRKQRSSFQITPERDTTTVQSAVRQERLTAQARLYIPSFKNQAIAFGNETKILVSKDFDEGDLFRLGGAQSLRGYDEDRYRGRFVTRGFIEYRYLFERRSYGYLFFDVGYVDQPATPQSESLRSILPGYGLGIQFETGIGLINTSLALSTRDNPSQAKVHVGLSLGL